MQWLVRLTTDEAVWEKGLFSKQTSVCRLRDERTLEYLGNELNVELED